MKHLRMILFSLAAVVTGFLFSVTQPTQAANNGSEFSISPVLPEAQADQKLSYFSLETEPNMTYPLQVTIENLNQAKAQEFDVSLLTAGTSSTGKINYGYSGKSDGSALTTLADLALDQPTKKKVSVPAGGKKDVTFTVTMPKNNIVGTVLGSVYVRRISATSQSKHTIGINNEFAMTVPVMLKQKNAPKILPVLAINSVRQETSGGSAHLVAKVNNSKPVMFGEIELESKVYKKGSSKAILTQTDHDFEMAPNSTMDYRVQTDGKALPAGRYVLKMRMTSGEETFNLEKEFGISVTEKRATEQQLVTVNRTKPWGWWIFGAVLALGIIALIVFLIMKRRRKKENDNLNS